MRRFFVERRKALDNENHFAELNHIVGRRVRYNSPFILNKQTVQTSQNLQFVLGFDDLLKSEQILARERETFLSLNVKSAAVPRPKSLARTQLPIASLVYLPKQPLRPGAIDSSLKLIFVRRLRGPLSKTGSEYAIYEEIEPAIIVNCRLVSSGRRLF